MHDDPRPLRNISRGERFTWRGARYRMIGPAKNPRDFGLFEVVNPGGKKVHIG